MTTAIITDPQDFFSCIIQLEIQIQYIIQLETDSILGTKAGFFLFFSFCLDFLSLLYLKIPRKHDTPRTWWEEKDQSDTHQRQDRCLRQREKYNEAAVAWGRNDRGDWLSHLHSLKSHQRYDETQWDSDTTDVDCIHRTHIDMCGFTKPSGRKNYKCTNLNCDVYQQ